MKLVEFVRKDGTKVSVIPNEVASVSQRTVTSTDILMRNGETHTVEVAYQDVADELAK